jgi:hypothetical protein
LAVTSFLIAEIVSLATIFHQIAACKAIANCAFGITSFNFLAIALQTE